ncbi:helix-turn-helix domain-containing protein [Nocardia huaxiensis]|uniref:Helix-turn-helix domain-containing protein n=1 Tax=Nocardia huaxiensis TaxID=2755382 RepID=A0A7D6V757_9NOCA|nr:helix-turn-helix domain-containing protein [Nocardia huaxiensis]QLY29272.1 helix-turn-helix domain-containing protein [Nocardia huaxiensis]
MNTTAISARGRLVAWAGFVFGSLTSIAANVLHTWLPAATMPAGWTPGIAPQIGAAVWPIGLLLSVEVISRATWRPGPWWTLARYGGAGTVALGSAVISYSHVRDVLLAWGYGHPAAEFGPLTLDGLMVVCGFALVSMTRPETTESPVPTPVRRKPMRFGEPAPAVPYEVPLALQVEPLTPIPGRRVDTATAVSGQADTSAGDMATEEDTEVDSRRQRARELHAAGWSHGRIAAELEVSKRTVRRYVATSADTDPGDGDREDSTPDTGLAADWRPEAHTNHHDDHEGVPA